MVTYILDNDEYCWEEMIEAVSEDYDWGTHYIRMISDVPGELEKQIDDVAFGLANEAGEAEYKLISSNPSYEDIFDGSASDLTQFLCNQEQHVLNQLSIEMHGEIGIRRISGIEFLLANNIDV